MGRRLRPRRLIRRTSRKIPEIHSKRGMRQGLLIGRPASTLLSDGNLIIARRMCRTGRDPAESRLLEETTDSRLHLSVATAAWRLRLDAGIGTLAAGLEENRKPDQPGDP